MRRHWKRLAERASNAAWDAEERREALTGALQRDWRVEVPAGFVGRVRDILDDQQGDLFRGSATARLEALSGETADSPLAGAVLDCMAQALHEGYRGEEALEKAVCDALLERARSGGRQVEEHWLRESSTRSARFMSNRIDEAIAALNMNVIVRRCVGRAVTVAPRGPVKKSGIDDGVSLA